MADTVGEFLIKLGLDANGIDKKINNVVSNIGNSLKNLATGVLAPALGALAGGEFLNSIAEEANEVERLSKSMNMSMEDASAWTAAMANMGVEAGDVRDMFRDFADWMVDIDANDSGPLKDGIEQGLIPAVRDMNGEMKSAQDYVLEFADALKELDPQTAAGLANQIGLSDRDIASFIEQGGDAIRQQLGLAKEFGTYTKEDAAAAREFTASITTLTHSLKMAALPIFRAIAPILTNIAKGFMELIKRVEPAINQFGQILNDVFTQVLSVFSQGFEEMEKHANAFIPLLGGIATMIGVRLVAAVKSLTLASLKFIFSPWGAVLTALAAIGIVFEDFVKWLNGGESQWGEYFESIFGDAETAKQTLSEFFDSVKNEVQYVAKVIRENWGAIATGGGIIAGASVLWNIFKGISAVIRVIAGTKLFSLLGRGIVTAIGFLLRFRATLNLVGIGLRLLGASMGPIGLALTIIIPLIIENWDTLKDYFSQFVDFLSYVFNGIGQALGMVADIVTRDCQQMYSDAGEAFSALGDIISSVIDWIISAVMSLVDMIMSGVNTITDLLNSLIEVVSSVGDFVIGIFNAMASAFNTFVSVVSSGASTIIGWISKILSKLAELASNSLLGKVIGSIGGGVSALFSGGGYGNIDNSSTVIKVTNNGISDVEDLGNDDWSSILGPAIGGQK